MAAATLSSLPADGNATAIFGRKKKARTPETPAVAEVPADTLVIVTEPEAVPVEAEVPKGCTPDADTARIEPAFTLPTASAPGFGFTRTETEHVKFSNYDPFCADGSPFMVAFAEQDFCYPYKGKFLSGYGMRGRSMHAGVDIKAIPNDTIRAAFGGVVRLSRVYYGYGNCIVIRHNNGLETLYGHNSRNLVQVGDTVRAGQPVSLAGRTGRATTEHLHFEVRVQGQHFNPNTVLDYDRQCLQNGVLVVSRRNGVIAASRLNSGDTLENAFPAPGNAPLYAENTINGTIPPPPPASAATIAQPSGSAPSSSTVYHTVVSGDTLSGIAVKYKTTVTRLCQLNHIDRNAILPLKKKLRVR